MTGEIAVARREHRIEAFLPIGFNLREHVIKMAGPFAGQQGHVRVLFAEGQNVIHRRRTVRGQFQLPDGQAAALLCQQLVRFARKAKTVGQFAP